MKTRLFRGLSVNNLAPWIIGYYHFDKQLNQHFICDADTLTRHEVRGETVGQCSGLADKNGKDVYEDDILHRIIQIPGHAERGEFTERVVLQPGGFFTIDINKDDNGSHLAEYWCHEIEIIGTIHTTK